MDERNGGVTSSHSLHVYTRSDSDQPEIAINALCIAHYLDHNRERKDPWKPRDHYHIHKTEIAAAVTLTHNGHSYCREFTEQVAGTSRLFGNYACKNRKNRVSVVRNLKIEYSELRVKERDRLIWSGRLVHFQTMGKTKQHGMNTNKRERRAAKWAQSLKGSVYVCMYVCKWWWIIYVDK